MKTCTSTILFLIFINILSAQNSYHVYGIYCASGKGLSCISINKDSIALNVEISTGSFNEVSEFNYQIEGDTITILGYMNFYWHKNRLYWFDNQNEVILEGGLRKINNRKFKRYQRKYKAVLSEYNLCFSNNLIKSCNSIKQ